MKTKITTLILLFAVIYLFGLIAINTESGISQKVVYKKMEVEKNCERDLISDKRVEVEKICERDLISEFLVKKYGSIEGALARTRNSGEYEEGVYDCSQFSCFLVEELRKEGYWATLEHGWRGDTPHAWVSIHIEAQSGRFLSPDEYILDPQVAEWDRIQVGD
jgi:hypothetical protein